MEIGLSLSLTSNKGVGARLRNLTLNTSNLTLNGANLVLRSR